MKENQNIQRKPEPFHPVSISPRVISSVLQFSVNTHCRHRSRSKVGKVTLFIPYLLTITFLGFLLRLPAQQQAPYFELHDPLSGNHHYQASQYIKLMPGFEYKATAGATFRANINPCLLFPPVEGETGGAEGGIVGTISGNLLVSPSGAAIYNIPISVPPGVAGMEPQLALTYNSQGGNGIIGLGWGLSGLSAISRTGKTIYHDELVGSITFSGDDNFMLDGNRLIAINEDKTEFRTEVETYNKIIVTQSNASGPEKFQVRTKDGMLLEYGYTINSRHKPYGKQEILSWYLNRIEDFQGNYIVYDYEQSEGEIWVSQIRYGGNWKTGQESIYEINFEVVQGRVDPNKYFISGGYVNMCNLLTSISIRHISSDKELYVYSFEYDQTGTYSRLKKVELGDEYNNKYNPTSFEWHDQQESFSKLSTNIQKPGYNFDLTFGDFNGNGKTDVVCAYYVYNQGNKEYDSWDVYYSSPYHGTFTRHEMGSLSNFPNNEKFAYFVAGDFNGDGIDDLARINISGTFYANSYSVKYLFSTGISFIQSPTVFIHPIYIDDFYFQVTDMNGNGIEELLLVMLYTQNITWFGAFEYDPTTNQVYSLFTNPPSSRGYSFEHSSNNLFLIKPGDFNGDGKTDLLVNTDALESTIFSLDEVNNVIFELPQNRFGYPNKYHRVFTGDFNGDGITDIITNAYTNPNVSWELRFFDGKDTWHSGTCPITGNWDPYASQEDNHLLISDYNGDGKSDILTVNNVYSGVIIIGTRFNIHYSRGNQFLPYESKLYEHINLHQSLIHNNFDFNGDGKSECFVFEIGSQSNTRKIISFYKNDKSNLVKHFNDGLDFKSTVLYQPITDNSIYEKGNGAQYPIIDFQLPVYVVVSEMHDFLIENTLTKTYRYAGAVFHQHGKGFLGFGTRATTDVLTGIRTEVNTDIYISQGKYFFPYTSSTRSFKNSNLLLSESTNTLNHKTHEQSQLIFFPYFESSYGIDYDYSTLNHIRTSKTNHEYDGYGNLIFEENLIHPVLLPFEAQPSSYDHQSKTSTTYYPPDLSNWLIARPDIILSELRYQEKPWVISAVKHQYFEPGNVRFPLLKEVKSLPDNDPQDELVKKTIFDYDSFGNRISKTLSAPNYQPPLPNRSSSIEYSSQYQYRFPTSTTNPKGYTTSSTYNLQYGWLTSTTDFNVLSASYTHHPLGISSGAEYPDGTKQMSVLRWANGHTHAPIHHGGALYYSWRQVSGQTEVLTFYNKAGLELRTVSFGFDGNPIYIDSYYYQNGRLQKESLPYFPGDALHYTQYVYDNIGRLNRITYPDNTFTTKNYDDNKLITVNHMQQTEVQTYNAAGWLIESEDANGGKVNYDYFSDGNLKSAWIVNQPQTTVNLKYNSRRQRSELDDPNYGTATFEYNPFGELVEQVSPRNLTTSFTYDILGRMLTQTEPEGTTEWIYDETTPRRIGTLQSVTKGNHQTAYVYDELLRVVLQTESIGRDNYQSAFTYDHFGRPKQITYPSGFATKNEYNGQGHLRCIRSALNSTLLWQADEVNASGLITGFKTGNNLSTTNTYHPQTLRLEVMLTKKANNETVQDLEFQWTSIGNLHHRKKWISRPQNNSITESFTYDDLNRLESIYLNGSHLGWHHYDDSGLGNLVYKKADGQVLFNNAAYGQNNAGPHALTSAETSTGVFPAEQQLISYNSYNKADIISEGNKQLQITYGHHRQRITQHYSESGNTIDKVWAGACEYITENGQQKIITYLSGPAGVFALHVKNPNGIENIRYIRKDHLGSWNTITDENGNLLQELSFDAWGNRRNPATWRAFTGIPPTSLFDHGFTGHEHLYGFQLINMNGRMYDPVVSRMLSPDNFIQSPNFSQSFNRYSYVWNNPLVYTDPDGEWVHLAVGALIGGATNWMLNGGEFSWDGLKYFGVGALAGALSAGVGNGLGSALVSGGSFKAGFFGVNTLQGSGLIAGAISGAGSGMVNGFILGVGNSSIQGSDKILENGFNMAWKHGLGGLAYGALSGTIDAIRNDRHIITGSPHKRYYLTDGENVLPIAKYNKNDPEMKDYMIKVEQSEEPFDLFIKTPKGYKTGHGYVDFEAPRENVYWTMTSGKKGSTFHFYWNDEGNYYIGAVVTQRFHLNNLNSPFNIRLIHYHSLRPTTIYSNLFWFLN